MRCRPKTRPSPRNSGVDGLDRLNLARTPARTARLLFFSFHGNGSRDRCFGRCRGCLLGLRGRTAAPLGRLYDHGLIRVGAARAAGERAERAFILALVIGRLRVARLRRARLFIPLLTLGPFRTVAILALRPFLAFRSLRAFLTVAVLTFRAVLAILPRTRLEPLTLLAIVVDGRAVIPLALFVLIALVVAVIILVADIAIVMLAATAIGTIVVLLVLRLTLFLPGAHLGDDAVVVVCVLQIIFGLDALALLVRFACEVGVFLEQLKRIAALARLHVAVAHFTTAALLGTRIAAPTTPTGLLLPISHEILFSPILPAEPTVVVQDMRGHPRKGPEATAKRFCLS